MLAADADDNVYVVPPMGHLGASLPGLADRFGDPAGLGPLVTVYNAGALAAIIASSVLRRRLPPGVLILAGRLALIAGCLAMAASAAWSGYLVEVCWLVGAPTHPSWPPAVPLLANDRLSALPGRGDGHRPIPDRWEGVNDGGLLAVAPPRGRLWLVVVR